MWPKRYDVHINIYPTKSKCKILFFKQSKNNIEILSEVEKNIAMNNRIFVEKTVRDKYINDIVELITSESLKYGKCRTVFINLQESDVIVKNISIDSEIKKKDIIKVIDIEMKEFCLNSFDSYFKDYKILDNDREDTEVQVVLFPKKYIDIFSDICDEISVENRAMHTNFSLMERILRKTGVLVMKKNGFCKIAAGEKVGVVEFRENDIVISTFVDKNIKDSYVIKKEEFTDEIAEEILGPCIGVLGVGNTSIEDIKIVNRLCNLAKVDFEELEFTKNGKRVSAMEYFNIAGKRIN